MKTAAYRSQAGYTLLELMTALSIMGILIAIGAPSFNDYNRNSRTLAAQNDLVTALNLARSEAVQRSLRVSVCASSDGASCTGNATWNDGWIVFRDGGTAGTVDNTDAVLRVAAGPPATSVQIPAASAQNFYSFLATGTASPSGSIEVLPYACTAGDRKLRQIAITAIGTIRSTLALCP